MFKLAFLLLFIVSIFGCKQRNLSESKIVDGIEVAAGQFPTVGEITVDAKRRYLGKPESEAVSVKDMVVCTAELICDDVILTAAHCVMDFAGKNAGFVDLDASYYFRTDAMQERRELDWYMPSGNVPHPKFAPQGEKIDLAFDVALLKLKQPAEGFEDINFFPLAQKRIGKQDPILEQKQLIGVGYSATDGTRLRSLHIRKMGYFGFLNYSSHLSDEGKNYSDMLAVAMNKQKICAGDSGGPIYLRRGTHYEQIGLASWIDIGETKWIDEMRCRDHNVAMYTSIPDRYEWIATNASKMCRNPQQFIKDTASVPYSEKFKPADMEFERHLTFYRPGSTENIPVKCTYPVGDYYLSDFYLKFKTGSLHLQYSTYDPENYIKPWANSSHYVLSRHYSRKDMEWLIAARPPTAAEIRDFMNQVLQKEAQAQGHSSWKFIECK